MNNHIEKTSVLPCCQLIEQLARGGSRRRWWRWRLTGSLRWRLPGSWRWRLRTRRCRRPNGGLALSHLLGRLWPGGRGPLGARATSFRRSHRRRRGGAGRCRARWTRRSWRTLELAEAAELGLGFAAAGTPAPAPTVTGTVYGSEADPWPEVAGARGGEGEISPRRFGVCARSGAIARAG